MIIAFTGAGISKASNIPTFSEQPEVRNKLFRSYALKYPEDYRTTIGELKKTMKDAQPNDAHIALAEYEILVITMNIDGLHEKAGSKPITLHGSLPEDEELAFADELYNKPVLYGDAAPNYQKAFDVVKQLRKGDTLLVIGASFQTMIAGELRDLAKYKGAAIIEIQQNAHTQTRKYLESLSENKEGNKSEN